MPPFSEIICFPMFSNMFYWNWYLQNWAESNSISRFVLCNQWYCLQTLPSLSWVALLDLLKEHYTKKVYKRFTIVVRKQKSMSSLLKAHFAWYLPFHYGGWISKIYGGWIIILFYSWISSWIYFCVGVKIKWIWHWCRPLTIGKNKAVRDNTTINEIMSFLIWPGATRCIIT